MLKDDSLTQGRGQWNLRKSLSCSDKITRKQWKGENLYWNLQDKIKAVVRGKHIILFISKEEREKLKELNGFKLCEYTENHWIVYLKSVNFVIWYNIYGTKY